MIFDITSLKSALDFISMIYNKDEDSIIDIIIKDFCDTGNNDFINNTLLYVNNNINELDIKNIEVVGEHITTCVDNCVSFKELGILDLQNALDSETTLNQFLARQGIQFNIENRVFVHNGITKNLKQYNYSNRNEEIFYLNWLYNRIYFDNQVNGFLLKKDEKSYSNIYKRPEIIDRIDDYRRFLKLPEIGPLWESRATGYLIQFKIPINIVDLKGTFNCEKLDNVLLEALVQYALDVTKKYLFNQNYDNYIIKINGCIDKKYIIYIKEIH